MLTSYLVFVWSSSVESGGAPMISAADLTTDASLKQCFTAAIACKTCSQHQEPSWSWPCALACMFCQFHKQTWFAWHVTIVNLKLLVYIWCVLCVHGAHAQWVHAADLVYSVREAGRHDCDMHAVLRVNPAACCWHPCE